MHGVAEIFRSVIKVMTYGTDTKLPNLVDADTPNLTKNDPNNSIDKPQT